MTWLDAAEGYLSRPLARALIVLACMMLATWNAYPHLGESIWQDEAVTLSFHASRGFIDPFLHYISPNNHIAFTAMLAAWIKVFPGGVDVWSLRLLPFVLFLVAVPATYFAAYRLGGPLCAAVATAVFSTSLVSANFATQLRGYGPSWLFMSLALFAALTVGQRRRKRIALPLYALGCMAAVAILPTNLYFLLIIGTAVALPILIDQGIALRERLEAAIALLAIPLLAFAFAYGAVWSELVEFSTIQFSTWGRLDLVSEWLRGSLASMLWLVPFALVGLLVAAKPNESAGMAHGARPHALTAVGLVVGLIALLLVIPTRPFPRTLVPYLPIWICGTAFLTVEALRFASTAGARTALPYGAGAVLLTVALLPRIGGCSATVPTSDPSDYGLCHQYFRDQYHPEAVLDAWASQSELRPIVTGFEGFYSLKILGSPASIFEYRHYRPDGSRPLVVARSRQEGAEIASQVGIEPDRLLLISDTGYFKVYGQPLP